MAEENKFTSNEFKARCREIRAELRRDYMNGHTPSYLKENQ
jgi:hypothetical protein